MNEPLVEFEIDIPADRYPGITIPSSLMDTIEPNRPNKGKDLKNFKIGRVKKLRLTEESELALFGSLGKYRDCALPPLPWGRDPFRHTSGFLTEEQAKIYNNRIDAKYHDKPEIAKTKYIESGFVLVSETSWDVKLT